ncbi:SusD/RagB family nutrient-binding outer membrane lipoprotein [Parapedobacter koreensis]|uniref:Starch-binding associating with outer membrane n=1 Tax=Parapedobacter koreensis TaxID=332977 RepID=A0A1H7PWP5_9SPHI|nr:SusD/RagB family nutrient-binding outer membrane lipoprotein [Parapedobacter koreensis]SEL40152.1 Starch-binding associating with outer membrane [Parapedobacter koreensis]
MKKYIFGLVVAVLTFQACSNFEEINIDPNNPATVPAEMLLPPIISGGVGTMTASGTRAGQYVQHLAYLGGTSESDGRYNLTGASWREEWNGAMRLIKDVNQMKEIAQAAGQPHYEALAYINKVYILSLMTDAFGDIPYDEAGMGNVDGLEFPRYQAQEEVYTRMIEDLETANQLLSGVPPAVAVGRDILYDGDPTQWRKFANSLKIRILMRQSAKKDVSAQVAAIFNDPAQYPVFTSVADGATLMYNNSSDFYRWYIQNPPSDGSGVNFGDNSRISVTLIDLLQNTTDPRLRIYAAPTRNSYLANASSSSVPLEYRGQEAGLSSTEQTALYTQTGLNEGDFSVIGRRIRQENRAFLMTYSELLLMKAEAIQRGMGVNGAAADVYRQAVDASFGKWQQVGSQTQIQNPYIDDNQRAAYWAIDANQYNPARGLEQIAEQYFIDSFLNGFEGWASWRRTGVPEIHPGPSVLSAIPVRYVYSDNEQNNPSLAEWVNQHMGGDMPDHNVPVWFQP